MGYAGSKLKATIDVSLDNAHIHASGPMKAVNARDFALQIG